MRGCWQGSPLRCYCIHARISMRGCWQGFLRCYCISHKATAAVATPLSVAVRFTAAALALGRLVIVWQVHGAAGMWGTVTAVQAQEGADGQQDLFAAVLSYTAGWIMAGAREHAHRESLPSSAGCSGRREDWCRGARQCPRRQHACMARPAASSNTCLPCAHMHPPV